MQSLLDGETIKLVAAGAGVLLANYFIARSANKGKASAGEVEALQLRLNMLAAQNETQQKIIDRLQAGVDRLNRELEICHGHRDGLIVERDKLSQQLVMLLLDQQRDNKKEV